jgi:hypothetical protein
MTPVVRMKPNRTGLPDRRKPSREISRVSQQRKQVAYCGTACCEAISPTTYDWQVLLSYLHPNIGTASMLPTYHIDGRITGLISSAVEGGKASNDGAKLSTDKADVASLRHRFDV